MQKQTLGNRQSRTSRNLEQGFTMVELLVTIIVLSILVPAFVTMITTLDSINDRARDMAAVHALAEYKIEGLRSINFTGLTNGTTNFTNELPATIAVPRSATYTVSSVNAALKQVDIAVSYNDHGSTRNLSYRTYIGELGVGQY